MITIPIPNVERRNINRDAQQLASFIGIKILQAKSGIEIKFDETKLDYEYTADPFELKIWVPGSRRYFHAKTDRVVPFTWFESTLFTD